MRLPSIVIALGLLALGTGALATETRFSAMVADVETGMILTADRIDSPRDPALIGRLSTIAMGIQDLADEAVTRNETVRAGATRRPSFLEAMRSAAAGRPGWRADFTGVVNKIGQNARVFGLRQDAVADMAGLQATAMRVERGRDGGPDFAGYTTPRDMLRMGTSLLRAFPEATTDVFSEATGGIPSTRLWLYQDGMCMLSAYGPMSGRELLAVLTGAPGESECLNRAADLVARDDTRIGEARAARAETGSAN